MVDSQLLQAQTISELRGSRRVYSPEAAPLRLADGTPLYLEWVIEGDDGALYAVPAEPDGWLRRNRYDGQPKLLRPVPSGEAEIIVRLTCAGLDAPTAAEYSSESYLMCAQ